MNPINIKDKFKLFDDHWNPRIIGELNGQHVKIAKFKGEFDMHHHENEDELFLVISGKIKIRFEDKTVELSEGEMLVIPKGVRHQPSAEEEAAVLMFEPASTVNTGENDSNELTRSELDWI